MSETTASLFELFGLGDPDDTAWLGLGLCAQTDPELFFPEKGGSPRPAKRLCMGCPVRRQCREYAVARPELDGIWGGTTQRQRQQQRRQQLRDAGAA
jgi:WhiB family redox-sensing transcriptional regulator